MKKLAIELGQTLVPYLILCAALFGMGSTIIQYIGFDSHAAFLAQKQDYITIKPWRFAFYIHAFTCVFCLFAGFTQFSSFLLKEHRALHRLMGRLYAITILIINFPVALIMAYYANGLIPSRIAFFILDVLWFTFTLKAVIAIRKKDVKSHREWMIRSFALTFSAITNRTWKLVLAHYLPIDNLSLYMLDAWLGFVPNILVAELIIRFTRKPSSTQAKLHNH